MLNDPSWMGDRRVGACMTYEVSNSCDDDYALPTCADFPEDPGRTLNLERRGFPEVICTPIWGA